MSMIFKYLKRYPLSLMIFAVIVFLSLFKPSDGVSLSLFEHMDKVAHFVMYAGLSTIIWFEFFRSHSKIYSVKAFLAMFLIPALFSGLMEYLQSELTTYRSGDGFDLVFNILGIVFANIACMTLLKRIFGNRDKK